MDKIQDLDLYLESMSSTLSDKCWWVDKIPDTIDTVVDFGCAAGDLGLYLEKTYPGRFRYVGIDNSDRMLSLALQNHALQLNSEFYQDISDMLNFGGCQPSQSVLVLNSVMHEILTYLSLGARKALLSELFSTGFEAVAIRDMYLFDYSGQVNTLEFFSKISMTSYATLWRECDELMQLERWHSSLETRVVEFLLKYRYINNWNREKRERYLWQWIPFIQLYLEQYSISYEENFSIPFIQRRIMRDFGISLNVKTHKKLLFERVHHNEGQE